LKYKLWIRVINTQANDKLKPELTGEALEPKGLKPPPPPLLLPGCGGVVAVAASGTGLPLYVFY
jgi:hypothetical protein